MFKENPYTWDNSSSSIKSNVIDIVVEANQNISSSNMSEDISVTIYRDPTLFKVGNNSFFLKPHKMNSTSSTKEYLKFHCFTRRSNYTAINFELKPENPGIHFNVRNTYVLRSVKQPPCYVLAA